MISGIFCSDSNQVLAVIENETGAFPQFSHSLENKQFSNAPFCGTLLHGKVQQVSAADFHIKSYLPFSKRHLPMVAVI